MPASTSSDLPASFDSLAPPPRFGSAQLQTYTTESAGQKRALQAAGAFVERLQEPLSLVDRLPSWARHLLPGSRKKPPRGLYLVGPAGTGKTHLMAATYNRLMPEVRCAFLHSHQFFRSPGHPEKLARELVRSADRGPRLRALMLDEVELDDAANEARLASFLSALNKEGVALFATSNARPDEFLSRHVTGGGRHRRFLTDALAGRCEVVFVEGADRRRTASVSRAGVIFVGPPAHAREALRETFEADPRRARCFSFNELRRASRELPHDRLMDRLLKLDSLYIAGLSLRDSDDALRLLRIVDALYVAPDAPDLYFSATTPPEQWFAPSAENGLAAGIAEKFARTVSRLHELCEVRPVPTKEAIETAPKHQDSSS